ncbi:MAG: preprotein translocase subunit SecA, partial [Pseudomonadota bacterium]
MLPKLLTSIFGSRNDRLLKQYQRVVERINALEPQYEQLTAAALRATTAPRRQRGAPGAERDAIRPAALAGVREGGNRTLKLR